MRPKIAVHTAISLALAAACGEKRALEPTQPSSPAATADTPSAVVEVVPPAQPSASIAQAAATIDAGSDAAGNAPAANVECKRSKFGATCQNTLGPAPEHLASRQPRGGAFVPQAIQCLVVIEAAVPFQSFETINGPSTSKQVPYTNADAHPKRVVARYGKCSGSFEAKVKAALKSEPQQPALLFENGGVPFDATQLRAALVPIDSPEKLALYLEVAPFPASFFLNKNGELFVRSSSKDPQNAKGACFGCSAYELTRLPTGEFEVVGLSTEVAETAGCHSKSATFRTVFRVDASGNATPVARTQIGAHSSFCVGRAPEGYVPSVAVCSSASYFEQLYRDERASVASFERLARELADLGAPEGLRRRAADAAREEVRHAGVMRDLARQEGHVVAPFTVEPNDAPRTLFEVAKENLVEGCIGETFAAAVAAHQAAHATDPGVRTAMESIAGDEASHAALAHDLHAWFAERVSEAEHRELQRAARARIEELGRSYDVPSAPWRLQAGEPAADAARAMLATLRATLWDA